MEMVLVSMLFLPAHLLRDLSIPLLSTPPGLVSFFLHAPHPPLKVERLKLQLEYYNGSDSHCRLDFSLGAPLMIDPHQPI